MSACLGGMMRIVRTTMALCLLGLLLLSQKLYVAEGINEYIRLVEWSPDGQKLFVAYDDSDAQVLDTSTFQPIITTISPDIAARAASWSPDGSLLAISDSYIGVVIVDSANGAIIREIYADGFAEALSWHPNSDLLATHYRKHSGSASQHYINIWNPLNGELIISEQISFGENGNITTLAWNPNGSLLATTATEYGALILDPNDLSLQVQLLEGAESPHAQNTVSINGTLSLSWNHDGTLLATGSTYGILRIWDTNTWQQIDFSLLPEEGLNLSQIEVEKIEWNPTQSLIAIKSPDALLLYNAESLELIEQIDSSVYDFSWSPDGDKLAYSKVDGLHIFSFPNTPPSCTYSPTTPTDLVNAITDANGTPEPDTICLTGSTTYTFTTAYIPLNALPAITSEITIIGNGATLTRQTGSPLFGFFEVSAGGSLTLENLTLSGGDVGNDTGGALVNEGGTVTLNNVTFSNNHANTGGAIDNESGSLTLTDSTFENNQADYGGAIDNDTGGTLSISGSTFTSNTAALDGGAIHNDGGTLTVTDSTFTSNTAGRYGGALDNTGSAVLSGSTFSGNSASWSGGAIRNTNSLTVNNGSVLESNAATLGGNGEGWGGGVYNTSSGTATISSSTLSENEAIQGGGIRNHGSLTLNENTQLTGNSASSRGGGIYNAGGTIQLTDSALLNNTATGDGGAIYTTSLGSQVTITGSTLSGNTAGASGGAIRS
ncbi:MAG: hypothetical protein F9K28_11200, partial [Bacteroidetes bacterium]